MSSLFSKKRHDANKDAGIFKCTAQKDWVCTHCLLFWLALTVQPTGACTKAITCFLALADLLDLIQGVIHIESAADLIDDAVSNLPIEMFGLQLCGQDGLQVSLACALWVPHQEISRKLAWDKCCHHALCKKGNTKWQKGMAKAFPTLQSLSIQS